MLSLPDALPICLRANAAEQRDGRADRHRHIGADIFALEPLVERAGVLALIAAGNLPAERQGARPLADAAPGDMVGRAVEAAAARDARCRHARRVDVALGIADRKSTRLNSSH